MLRGMVTEQTLQATFDQDRWDLDLRNAGVTNDRNFSVDQAARVFSKLVLNETGLSITVGYTGPLQQPDFGGTDNDLMYIVLAVPDGAPPVVSRVWIWNNNEPETGHYEGIRDAQ